MSKVQERRIYVIVQSKGRVVRADYAGGAYIDLTFGHTGHQPTEVINVWDYATGKAEIDQSSVEIRTKVREWIADNDIEWPEWYEGYLENAGY